MASVEVQRWLDKFGFRYNENSDGSFDFVSEKERIGILDHSMKRLPITIRNANRSIVLLANNLTTLKGLPKVLHGHFILTSHSLKTLVDGPTEVYGDCDFRGLSELRDLNGLAKYIEGELDIRNCPSLTPEGCIPALLSQICGSILCDQDEDLIGILMEDRKDGRLPRELIPERINELRELKFYDPRDRDE
jgi:hypothetical protein